MSVVYSFDFQVGPSSTSTKEIKIVKGLVEPILIETGSSQRKVEVKVEIDGNQVLPALAGGDAALHVTPPDVATPYSVDYANRRDLAVVKVTAKNTDTLSTFSVKVTITVAR
jgi:phage FluMu gp28-like protein